MTETMGISGGLYIYICIRGNYIYMCVLHVSHCSAYGRVVSEHRVRMPHNVPP